MDNAAQLVCVSDRAGPCRKATMLRARPCPHPPAWRLRRNASEVAPVWPVRHQGAAEFGVNQQRGDPGTGLRFNGWRTPVIYATGKPQSTRRYRSVPAVSQQLFCS